MKNPLTAKDARYNSIRTICLIIGITSLAVFIWNIFALVLTANLQSVQWRVNFLEQTGNRSFALLFGFGLMLYSFLDNRILRKKVAFVSLMAGLMFQMSCILTIHDALALQEQAFTNIAQQSQQMKTKIQTNSDGSISPQQAEQVTQQVTNQADELKQRAKSDITRAGIVSLGNLFIPGLGLLGLGWIGLKKK